MAGGEGRIRGCPRGGTRGEGIGWGERNEERGTGGEGRVQGAGEGRGTHCVYLGNPGYYSS